MALRKLKYYLRYPLNIFGDVERWVAYRSYDKYNVIPVPSLEPGYYDKDTILTHGVFDLLSDYVEVELGIQQLHHEQYRAEELKHSALVCSGQKTRAAIYKFLKDVEILPWFIRRQYRNPKSSVLRAAALRYFDESIAELESNKAPWEGASKKDILKHKKWNKHHVHFKKEARDLYLWYKDTFLKREDSSDVVGLHEFYLRLRREGKNVHNFVKIEGSTCSEMKFGGSKADERQYNTLLKKSWALDEARRQEDEEMLIRLIKIREGLWT